MASYRTVGVLNSPNTNNNNNNNLHMSSTLNRDPYNYSSTKYNQQQNSYKALTMPKSHYQNLSTTTKDNGTNYLSASSSFDSESNPNINEPTKRIANPNGKFSIQKMIRHGFSSWRTRKKPPSTPPPPPTISTNSIYTNTSTSPTSQPPLSTGRYMTNNDDFSQIPPPTAVRSISVDSITNRTTSPQKIIVTEPTTLSSARANSVDSVTIDFDRPPTVARAFVQSPWTSSSISTTKNNMTTITPVTTESISRPTPVPVTRILPVHFTENNKIPSPRSPPLPQSSSSSSSAVSPLPPRSLPSPITRTIETNTSTTPSTNIISNPQKIPPPGIFLFFFF